MDVTVETYNGIVRQVKLEDDSLSVLIRRQHHYGGRLPTYTTAVSGADNPMDAGELGRLRKLLDEAAAKVDELNRA